MRFDSFPFCRIDDYCACSVQFSRIIEGSSLKTYSIIIGINKSTPLSIETRESYFVCVFWATSWQTKCRTSSNFVQLPTTIYEKRVSGERWDQGQQTKRSILLCYFSKGYQFGGALIRIPPRWYTNYIIDCMNPPSWNNSKLRASHFASNYFNPPLKGGGLVDKGGLKKLLW